MDGLRAYPQFIIWKLIIENGKENKVPVSHHNSSKINPHTPVNWTDYKTANAAAHKWGAGYGIGFVFTANDPFFFIDIDKCLQLDNTWSPLAMSILQRFVGAAVEISQSGKGLHVIAKGQAPEHSCKNSEIGAEFYTQERFVALTERGVIGDINTNHTAALESLVADYFVPKIAADGVGWTTEPHADCTNIDDDEVLLKKALASKSVGGAFGAKASFKALWLNDVTALAEAYPDEHPRQYDYSSADAALAQQLAFWTGNNCERMRNLMVRSALKRDKWDSHKSYLKLTIEFAIGGQNTFYNVGKKTTIQSDSLTVERVEGFQYMTIDLQLEHFKGCVYVQKINKIFTPCGEMLKTEQFNNTYGGYAFQLDTMGDKTTRKAWEAFTESQAIRHIKVNRECFRPDRPSGELIKLDGMTYVNSYVPVNVAMKPGDMYPFNEFFKKLLPDDRDREILWSYMAACVQHKGVKFQWCPLIQGVEGNGKTLITRVLTHAIGTRYTHLPLANEITEKFNDWLFHRLLIGVEDVYVPDHKREIIEILKPMITNDWLPMRAMQQSQDMGNNVANFVLNSNHRAGIRKTRNDRRFCVFYTAQQAVSDLVRDGMDGDYFPNLYEWLKSDGYEIITQSLVDYKIADSLNPATKCKRAPITTATEDAIDAGMGGIEQEILEAIAEGRNGFAGGWVSSMAIERLLQNNNLARAMPRNKRKDMMHDLDYGYHPGLKDGRVNEYVPVDGGKPRLYIKNGHIHANLTNPHEIINKYQNAQPGHIDVKRSFNNA